MKVLLLDLGQDLYPLRSNSQYTVACVRGNFHNRPGDGTSSFRHKFNGRFPRLGRGSAAKIMDGINKPVDYKSKVNIFQNRNHSPHFPRLCTLTRTDPNTSNCINNHFQGADDVQLLNRDFTKSLKPPFGQKLSFLNPIPRGNPMPFPPLYILLKRSITTQLSPLGEIHSHTQASTNQFVRALEEVISSIGHETQQELVQPALTWGH